MIEKPYGFFSFMKAVISLIAYTITLITTKDAGLAAVFHINGPGKPVFFFA